MKAIYYYLSPVIFLTFAACNDNEQQLCTVTVKVFSLASDAVVSFENVKEFKKALDLRVFKNSIRQVYDTLCKKRDSRNESLLSQTNEIIHKNEKQQQQLIYSNRINTFYMMAILIFIGLIAVSVLIIYKLRSNNQQLRKEISVLNASSPKATNKEKKEVSKPSVKPNSKKLKALFEQAEQVVKAQELFRNPGLRKQDLAETLRTNGTYLSNCINANAQKNYNDWINGLRIDYLVERLQSTSQIEALCQEAGFCSRSAFYASFKKKLNCTPGEYLQEQAEHERLEAEANKKTRDSEIHHRVSQSLTEF